MISFKVLEENSREGTLTELCTELSRSSREIVLEIASSLSLDGEDVEYALAISHGCLLIRVFDMGRYLFLYPYEISEGAELASAIDELCEYAKRQEVSLVLSDVPSDALSSLSGFRHMDIDAEDSDCSAYRVRVKTECEMCDEIPCVVHGCVALGAISDSDLPSYARLCKDSDLNKFWGYDYKDDVENPTDSYFLESARAEFARGVAMTAAIRADDSFVGEATVYAFDGRGGAEFAIRLLPEFHGRGLGRESVLAVAALASEIGLTHLYSRVKRENVPSHKMLSGIMEPVCECEGELLYRLKL